MRAARFVLAGVLLGSGLLAAGRPQSSPANRPWPPDVQRVSDESPALRAEDALKTFFMPPGYRLELVASEPLVQEPVALDWDLEGRLWVVEMPGWMPDITATGEHDPIGRVVVLEDTDRDGRMDKRTVFADKLILARSVKVLERGVLVGEPPHVWLMRDTDGDLRMDTRELVTDRYGRLEIDPQNNANGFDWAPDNRMYTAGQGDIHFRVKGGAILVEPTLRRGEWGVTHDDAGRVYRNTNESALHVDLVPTYYFARNPHLVRTRGSYERLAELNADLNVVWPVRPNPGTNRAYQAGIDRADGTLARFTSVCAPLVYRGDRLPELYGNVFVAEPAANLVSRIVLDAGDAAVEARKAYPRGEFLASTDERFRPVYLANAPDGTLYIADLYRGIIEHRISITTYLRDQIEARRLDRPTGYGRIYRVVHEQHVRRTDTPPTAAPAALLDLLSDSSGWWRDTAQRLIVERSAAREGFAGAVVPALAKMAADAKDWRTRLHALWTLDGIDAVNPDITSRALRDEAREVRLAAVRIAERWLAEPDPALHRAVLSLADDPSWAVRRQLAASIGAMRDGARQAAILPILERYADDAVTMDASLSSLSGLEPAVLARLLERREASPRRSAAITMLAATIVRAGSDADVHQLLAHAGDTARAEWQRAALLHGAEVALLGARPPGTPEPVRARGGAPAGAQPCPTCPGGRAGPGGAYAFPRPPGWPSSGRGTGPVARVSREPRELVRLAGGSGELASRAARLLERISWPGKAGEPAAPAALTAEEQQRFEAGRDVYRNVCQACHQPDGRGQERLAPSLIGSALAQGPGEIPARILLNGKEGTIGLMPPIGAAFNDEQVAAVLTFIRRAWGQAGTPVDAATVRAVRAATADRTRPWTDRELLELMGSGRQ